MGFVRSSCCFHTFLGHILVYPQPPWYCCETTLTPTGSERASTQATTREPLQLHWLKDVRLLGLSTQPNLHFGTAILLQHSLPSFIRGSFYEKTNFFFPKRLHGNTFLYTPPSCLCFLQCFKHTGFSNVHVQSPHIASTVFSIIEMLFQDLLVNFQLSSYSMGTCAWAGFSFTKAVLSCYTWKPAETAVPGEVRRPKQLQNPRWFN